MSRRPIIYRVGYSGDGDPQVRVITAREDFGLDFLGPQKHFGGDLAPRLVDLLRIGEAIWIVDRLVRRRSNNSRSWDRDLRVQVEVLDPRYWSSPQILDALRGAIEFVSGDFWDFEFFGGSVQYEWTRPLLSKVFAGESPRICLYSGGLDSAAGLALRLKEFPDCSILPVTIRHQPLQDRLIKSQYKILENRFGPRVGPLVIRTWMNRPSGWTWSRRERSQRGRSFLFAAAGAVAAIVTGQADVEVFESGIGSINIPLMAGMLGSMATRGCHPEFLRKMSVLASHIADREITFRLPLLDRTKGEMVRTINEAGFSDLVRATVSCARYPVARPNYKQCGVCPACISGDRRSASPGSTSRMVRMLFNLFGPAKEVNRIPPGKLNYLRAFLMQVASWADIEKTGRLPGAAERHLLHTRILSHGDSPRGIIDLLARHRNEWEEIAAEGRERGYRWASLLAPARVRIGQGGDRAFA